MRQQIGGALARDPVDEIERDVVKVGITESVDRASDVVRCRLPFEYGEEPWLEALLAPSETRVTPSSRSSAASRGVTVSGLASTVFSSAPGKPRATAGAHPAR